MLKVKPMQEKQSQESWATSVWTVTVCESPAHSAHEAMAFLRDKASVSLPPTFLVGSYIALNHLSLLIFLPLPTGCWEYRDACMLCPVPTVPRVKASAWYMLGSWAVIFIFWSQLLTERLSSLRCPKCLAWETLMIHTCKYLRELVESHIFCLNDRDSSLCNMQRL